MTKSLIMSVVKENTSSTEKTENRSAEVSKCRSDDIVEGRVLGLSCIVTTNGFILRTSKRRGEAARHNIIKYEYLGLLNFV